MRRCSSDSARRCSPTAYVATSRGFPHDATGWLAGLRDACVGGALAALHAEPGRAWSLDDLGGRVGLSRSALHDRFVRFLGVAPMQYLTRWRMQAATTRLAETSDPILAIADDLGYASAAAFSRAFSREVGEPPASYRRRHARG